VGDTYELRVIGALGPAGREAFADLALDLEPTATVLSGDLDQAGLHAVLEQVRALGLELVDVKVVPRRTGEDVPESPPEDLQTPV
jgi:hypothetical protein